MFLFQKRKQIKLQTTKRGNQRKRPTLFPDLLWICALMHKNKFYRKKQEFAHFSLSAYFLQNVLWRDPSKTNIYKHIF